MGNMPSGSATGQMAQMKHCQLGVGQVLVGREDLLGITCLYKASLFCLIQPPVSFLPIAFLNESSPHWPSCFSEFLVTLPFLGGGGRRSTSPTLLLISAMQQTSPKFNGLKQLPFHRIISYGLDDQEFLQSPFRRLFYTLWQQLRSVSGFSWQMSDLKDSKQLHAHAWCLGGDGWKVHLGEVSIWTTRPTLDCLRLFAWQLAFPRVTISRERK